VGSPVAGKTGTTEHSTDAWFIGYTPKLTTALWMGYADRALSMDGFRGLAGVVGGGIPAELWHQYMRAALAAEPDEAGLFPPADPTAGLILGPSRPANRPPTSPAPPPPSGTVPSTTTASSSTAPPPTRPTKAVRPSPTPRTTTPFSTSPPPTRPPPRKSPPTTPPPTTIPPTSLPGTSPSPIGQ